jgi:hypothetical protein
MCRLVQSTPKEWEGVSDAKTLPVPSVLDVMWAGILACICQRPEPDVKI